mmetsp:Transcript_134742/g.430527  ORF Transcript_134742/g.430527 Transcript_134742/m.430527 type:complete len:333 (+) Transcript_134742:600-1598(+)
MVDLPPAPSSPARAAAFSARRDGRARAHQAEEAVPISCLAAAKRWGLQTALGAGLAAREATELQVRPRSSGKALHEQFRGVPPWTPGRRGGGTGGEPAQCRKQLKAPVALVLIPAEVRVQARARQENLGDLRARPAACGRDEHALGPAHVPPRPQRRLRELSHRSAAPASGEAAVCAATAIAAHGPGPAREEAPKAVDVPAKYSHPDLRHQHHRTRALFQGRRRTLHGLQAQASGRGVRPGRARVRELGQGPAVASVCSREQKVPVLRSRPTERHLLFALTFDERLELEYLSRQTRLGQELPTHRLEKSEQLLRPRNLDTHVLQHVLACGGI